MDRKGGMAATAVLIAILGISFMPRKGGESASSAEPAGGAKNPRHTQEANPKLSEVKPACAEIADRVKRFIEGDIHYPASCYSANPNDAEQSVAGENLGFAIALVPDPSQTNLPLLFDRLIETIQQAAQDEKYSYDSSWFPWTEERTYDRFDDEEKAEALQTELQQQPGVLAFRGGASNAQGTYRGGLLVFVVGEQPTGGINDEQFENAMAWIAKLELDPKKLNI